MPTYNSNSARPILLISALNPFYLLTRAQSIFINLGLLYTFAVGTIFPAFAQSSNVVGCPTPPSSFNHTWYVDPVNGSMQGDGSAARPWHTLAEVFSNNLISSQCYSPPYHSGEALTPKNPNGVIKPGDLIYLTSGNHGSVNVNGYYNSSFITVQAYPGQTPVLSGLSIIGSSNWAFKDLTIMNVQTQQKDYMVLVNIASSNFWGPTNTIYFAGNHLLSQPDVSNWSQSDWLNFAPSAIHVSWAVNNPPNTAISILNNDIHNVMGGVSLSGSNTLFQNNTIDNVAHDFIDFTGSDLYIIGNILTNHHDVNDGYHNDFLQGWTVAGVAFSQNIFIDSNRLIPSTDPNTSPGLIQGISIFDGVFKNLTITNNVICTAAYHGIAMLGVQGCQIVNNSVVQTDPRYRTWIAVLKSKVGLAPTNTIVANNVAPFFNLSTVPEIITSHNIVSTDPQTLFTTCDINSKQYNLYPSNNSALIGAGTTNFAPAYDITGTPRTAPITVGAYQYGASGSGAGPQSPPPQSQATTPTPQIQMSTHQQVKQQQQMQMSTHQQVKQQQQMQMSTYQQVKQQQQMQMSTHQQVKQQQQMQIQQHQQSK